MPWSFGETSASDGRGDGAGRSGGWPGPDPSPIVEVHFDGLLATLRAIADGSYRDADPGSLRPAAARQRIQTVRCRRSSAGMCSMPIAAVQCGPIWGSIIRTAAACDVAAAGRQDRRSRRSRHVDRQDRSRRARVRFCCRDGSLICAIGCRATPLEADRLDSLLASGVTTVVGRVDPTRRDALEKMVSRHQTCRSIGVSCPRTKWGTTLTASRTLCRIAIETWRECERLGLGANRGKIRRESFADLAVYDAGAGDGVAERCGAWLSRARRCGPMASGRESTRARFCAASGENRLC